MAIVLPDFKDRRCVYAELCGTVPLAEFPEREAIPALENSLVARYTKNRRPVFMRLVLPFPGQLKAGTHVHVDLAVREWLGKKLPDANSTADQIVRTLSPFKGKQIETRLEGVFRVPYAELPPIVANTMVETAADDVQIQMTGGTLTIRGAPVEKLSWELVESVGEARIKLWARTKGPFTDRYLVDCVDLLDKAFRALVLGAQQNG